MIYRHLCGNRCAKSQNEMKRFPKQTRESFRWLKGGGTWEKRRREVGKLQGIRLLVRPCSWSGNAIGALPKIN